MKINNKGITLIALIITIIVMLILVAVSVRIVINSGLFESGKIAAQKTADAFEKEGKLGSSINIGGKTYKSLEDYIKSTNSNLRPPKIGDKVNYEPKVATYEVKAERSGYSEDQTFTTPTGNNKLTWRIFNIDEEAGKLLLISDTVTPFKLGLGNNGEYNGYENLTTIIDEMCTILFSNEDIGARARSINPEASIPIYGTDESLNLEEGECYPDFITEKFWTPITFYIPSTYSSTMGYVHGNGSSYDVADFMDIEYDAGPAGYAVLPVIEIDISNYSYIYLEEQ